MSELFLVFIVACLANNLVLDYLLGVSPLFAVSRTIETAVGMSLAMLLVLPLTTFCCHAVLHLLLVPLQLEFLQLLAFVVTASVVIMLLDQILARCKPVMHERTAVFMPLLLVNTAVVGVALIQVQARHGLLAALFSGSGAALGFGVVVVIFATLRQRLAAADVPLAFRGTPILLISLGILAMAFMGFSGLST